MICTCAESLVVVLRSIECVGASTLKTAARGADLSAHRRWISSGGRCLFSSQCVSFSISRILAICVCAFDRAMIWVTRWSKVMMYLGLSGYDQQTWPTNLAVQNLCQTRDKVRRRTMRKVSRPDDKRLMVVERISQTMERDEAQRSGRDEAVRLRVFIKKWREAPLKSQISMNEPPLM